MSEEGPQVDRTAPVTPDDYGTSWTQAGDDESLGCLALGFAVLFAPMLLVWLVVHLTGGL